MVKNLQHASWSWHFCCHAKLQIFTSAKSLWRAYRNSPTLFRTVPSTTPYGLPLPKIEGLQPQPKTAIAIISGTAKGTIANLADHRVHQNESPFGRKGGVGVSKDCPNFLSTPIISGTGKTTNFKFGRYIHRVHPCCIYCCGHSYVPSNNIYNYLHK